MKVRFYELDPYGHLNHSVYVQLFEIGRIELLEEARLGLHDLEVEGFRFVVSRITTKFLASAVAGDGHVYFLNIEGVSSRWGQRLLRGDVVLATQEVVAAVTGTNGRPTRFPADMAARLTPYLVAGT